MGHTASRPGFLFFTVEIQFFVKLFRHPLFTRHLSICVLCSFLLIHDYIRAQKIITLSEAIEMGLSQNLDIEISKLNFELERKLIGTAKQPAKTEFFYGHDRNNLTPENIALHVLGLFHTFAHPAVHKRRLQTLETSAKMMAEMSNSTRMEVERNIHYMYDQIRFHTIVGERFFRLDSLATIVLEETKKKYDAQIVSASSWIEALQYKEYRHSEYRSNEWILRHAQYDLRKLLNIHDNIIVTLEPYLPLELNVAQRKDSPLLRAKNLQSILAEQQMQENYARNLPEFKVSIFGGSGLMSPFDIVPGIQLGIVAPLTRKSLTARRQADEIYTDVQRREEEKVKFAFNDEYERLLDQLDIFQKDIKDFENKWKPAIESIDLLKRMETSDAGSKVQFIEGQLRMEISLFNLYHEYNKVLIQLHYMTE